MKKLGRCLFSFLCALLYYHSYAQAICSDSVISKKYTHDSWQDLELLYADPMVSLNDSSVIFSFKAFDSLTPEGIPSGDNSVLVKLNSIPGISWSKMNWIMDRERFLIRTLSPLNNGDILIQGNVSVHISNVSYRNFLGRLDSSGKLKWLRLYKENSIDLRKFSESETGDLYIYTGRTDAFPAVSRLTSTGEEVWSSVFELIGLPEFNTNRLFSIKAVDTVLYIFFSNFSAREGYSLNWRPSVCFLKIDLKNGKLLDNKSYHFPEKHNYYIDLPGFYDDGEGHFIIWGNGDSDTSDLLFKMVVDKNLNVTEAGQMRYLDKPKSDFPLLSLSPVSGNLIGTLVNKSVPTTLYYFSFDRAMRTRFQRKLLLGKGAKRTVAFENINTRISLVSFYYGNFESPYFTVTDFAPDLSATTDCSGEDASLFSLPEDLKLTAANIPVSARPYKIESISGSITQKNYQINEETICSQVSICDSIRIKGPTAVCDINEPQIFHIDKRQECLREVKWQIDAAVAHQPHIINDSTVSIRFKEGATEGYLKAAINSCDIADSIKILIPPVKNVVNLGRDTTLCNNIITLNAGKGYMFYQWQDGSKYDTLNVSDSGTYWVRVVDSCGRESSDTIVVKHIDLSFSAGTNQFICLYDSVNLQATKGYFNYQWSPDATLVNQKANTITAFPEITTKYIVSAEIFPKCIVKDSVIISVKDCPQDIHFPNAFSPNGDGLNDHFKPAIQRSLSHYQLIIYNRYGQVVFRSKEPSRGWDGYFKSQPQPAGLYVWVCEIAFPRQPKKSLKGKINLIR